MYRLISILSLTLILSVSPAWAADPLEVAPEMYTNLFENDKVRVLDLHVKAGAQIPEHSHPDHFVYAMNDGKLSITKDGMINEVEAKTGQVLWIASETHSTVNVGTTEFHGIVVELKG